MIGPMRTPCDEGVIRGAAAPAPCTQRAQPWVLAATIVASSMVFIDASVVSVALPSIQQNLAAPVSQAQWIVNAYVLTLGALILVGGAAGDRFGRRRVCIAGILVFTAASVWCGLALNSSDLVAARAAQGVGGALLVPSSLAIISASFPEQQRGRAIGTWAGASALTTALGPVLGGWLVDSVSWRAIFFVNVPLAIVALLLTVRWVPESRNESNAGVDWTGGVLAVAGLGMLAYGLTAASNAGWVHASVLGSLVGGVLVLLLLLRSEARAASPMLPLSLFRSSTFSGANAITLLLYFALSGEMFFLPFDLIDIQGYSATSAGAAFLPFSLTMAGLSRWSGGLNERYGSRALLIVGPCVVALGLMLFAVPAMGRSYWSTVFPAMTVWGFGMALSVAPLTTTVMRAAGDRYAGAASGINNATARIAGMLAVALLGVIAVGAFRTALNERLEHLHTPVSIRQALQPEVQKLSEAQLPPQADSATRLALREALRQSFVYSFRITTLISAAAALLSAACAWLTIDRTPSTRRQMGAGFAPRQHGNDGRARR
jgi:EmrB/QacA subfamily drug resistance transporter